MGSTRTTKPTPEPLFRPDNAQEGNGKECPDTQQTSKHMTGLPGLVGRDEAPSGTAPGAVTDGEKADQLLARIPDPSEGNGEPKPSSDFYAKLKLFEKTPLVSDKEEPKEEEEVDLDKTEIRVMEWPERTLFLFSLENRIRQWCIMLYMAKEFEQFINFLILMNCIFLGMYDPSQPEDTPANEVSAFAEHILIALFTMEVIIKSIAIGLIMPKYSYMHDAWNLLDIFVVILGLINYIPGMSNLSPLRTVRLLRPLRTINNNPGLRISCTALIESLPSLVDVFSLWLFCFVVFGILGMQFFMGKFHKHCIPEDLISATEEHMETTCGFTDCAEGFVCVDEIKGWNNETIQLRNPNYDTTSFDNFYWSFLLLFATLTREGWVQFNDLSAQAVGDAAYVFWVSLVWFGSFFVVNLATAVVFANYTRLATRETERKAMQEEADRKAGLKLERRESAIERKLAEASAAAAAPPAKKSAFRQFILTVVELQAFQLLVILVISLNTFALALEYDGMSVTLKNILDTLNLIFTFFFDLECILKVIAYGFVGYIKIPENAFDFFIVCVSTVELMIPPGSGPEGFSVLRTFRLLRVLKLFKSWDSIRELMHNVTQSLSSIGNFGIIASIMLFTFSLIGVQFFGDELCEEFACSDPAIGLRELCTAEWYPEGPEGPSEPRVWSCVGKPSANFRNLFWAFLTVFQCFTGENWHILVFQSMGATSWVAGFYYLALLLIGHYILMNLFLASIVHNVVESTGAKGAPRDAESRARLKELTRNKVDIKYERRAPKGGFTLWGNTAEQAVSLRPSGQARYHRSDSDAARIAEGGEISGPVTEAYVGREQLSLPLESREKARACAFQERAGPKHRSPGWSNLAVVSLTDDEEDMNDPETFGLDHRNGALRRSGDILWKTEGSPRPGAVCEATHSQVTTSGHSLVELEVTDMSCDSTAVSTIVLEEPPGGMPIIENVNPSNGNPDATLTTELLPEGEQPAAPPAPPELKPDISGIRGWSLNLFPPGNFLRKKCYELSNSTYFDYFIILCIMASSLTMALENPHRKDKTALSDVLYALDFVFTIVFVVEMCIKIVAYGFISPKHGAYGLPYIRDSWNQLDFAIVVISLLSFGLNSPQLKALKALRTLRALRPLRLLTHNEGMKRVVSTLMTIVPAIGNILVLVMLAWLIFAILGVQLFSGKFGECSDGERQWKGGYGPSEEEECVGTFVNDDGEEEAREWVVERPNFDHTGEALLALFELATLEDWDEVMYRGIAATEAGKAAQAQAHPENSLFFLFYIIVGAMFVMNIMISAVVNHFLRMKDTGASGFLTKAQTDWLDAQKALMSEQPEFCPLPPKQKWRQKLYHLALHPYFDYFIMGVIFLNILVMLTDHYNSSDTYVVVADGINLAFSIIFILEAAIKITAFNFRQYWVDFWNKFDFVIVCFSIVGFVVGQAGASLGFNPTMIRVFRVFRTARVLRMVRSAKGLRMLLRTFVLSLPSLWNVGALVFMAFFVFAVLGIYLLGDAPHGDTINGSINFESFGRAMFVLLRSCTGENWTAIFHAYMDEGYMIIVPYFLTFLLVVYFVLLNLFVAVILENFSAANQLEDAILGPTDFAVFSEVWKEFDPLATQTIPSFKVEMLIRKVPPPLGFKGEDLPTSKLMRILQEMDLADHGEDGQVHYVEVLSALAFRVSGQELPQELEQKSLVARERAFPKLKSLPPANIPLAAVMAAAKIQAAAKGLIARKRAAERLGKPRPSRWGSKGLKNKSAEGGAAKLTAELAMLNLKQKVSPPVPTPAVSTNFGSGGSDSSIPESFQLNQEMPDMANKVDAPQSGLSESDRKGAWVLKVGGSKPQDKYLNNDAEEEEGYATSF